MPERAVQDQRERLREIEERIFRIGRVRIGELAGDLGVSEMTIRRDLSELESLGRVRRIRGGAAAVGPGLFAERHTHNARAKGIIAAKVAQLVPDHGTVALDASSTVHRYAARLAGARDLLVVTNGTDTHEALASTPGVTAVLTGGYREPSTGSLVGPVAVRSAQLFVYDLLLCSCVGLTAQLGSTEVSAEEAEVKRAMRSTAARVLLAVDHTKLGHRSRARMLEAAEIDVLVTDLDPADPRLDDLRGRVGSIA